MKYLSLTILSTALVLTGCQTTGAPTGQADVAKNTEQVISSGLNAVYSGGGYAKSGQGLGSIYSGASGDTVVIREKSELGNEGIGAVTSGADITSVPRRDAASLGDFYTHPDYGKNVVGGPSSGAKDRVIYFAFDSSTIDERAKAIVKEHASHLAANPSTQIVLEGHTDSRGSREYNVALGERRGVSVAEMFKTLGVSPSQIRVVSYGEELPAVRGFTEDAYRRNRRAVILY